MEKVEQFIQEHTNRYSNHVELAPYITGFTEWLTIDDARRAVEIAREETLQEVKEKLLMMLNTSIDNKQFFEQLDDYIDELESK